MSARTRIYALFPRWNGRLSCRTEDYDGVTIYVAATNVRQAYALAYRDVKIDPGADRPLGIVAIRDKDARPHGREVTLWCGCRQGNVPAGHGDGVRAIRAAVAEHQCLNKISRIKR